jgi:hypothetical protein
MSIKRIRFHRFSLGALLIGFLLLLFPAAVTAQYTKKPSRIIQLVSDAVGPSQTEVLVQMSPAAVNLGAFTVPDGQVFVMTSLHVFPESYADGTLGVHIVQDTLTRSFYRVPASGPTQLQFPVGLVFAPGSALSIRNVFSGDPAIRATATGYLAPDV